MQEQLTKNCYGFSVILVMLITTIFTGLNGLIAFILLMILSQFNFGKDVDNKHGLSSGKSRLGGVAIILSIAFGCYSHLFFHDDLNLHIVRYQLNLTIFLSLLIGLIGLAEDLSQSLSSKKRLLFMLVLVSLSLFLLPQLLPFDLEIFEVFNLNNSAITVFIFTVFMICGFINAGNIADGANGLLASIFLLFFIIAYTLANIFRK